MKSRLLILVALVLLTSCANLDSRVKIERWGALKPVIMMGQDQGRIALTEIEGREHAYGVGALEGLAGEIIILDGRVWHSRASAKGLVTSDAVTPDLQAALLVVAEVPAWNHVSRLEATTWNELEDAIGAAVKAAGLDPQEPVPFLIEGDFEGLELHVINGSCPYRHEEGAPEPIRSSMDSAAGTLCGFFFEGEPGILTHHGQRLHVHALIPGDAAVAGHVDALNLAPACILSLP